MFFIVSEQWDSMEEDEHCGAGDTSPWDVFLWISSSYRDASFPQSDYTHCNRSKRQSDGRANVSSTSWGTLGCWMWNNGNIFVLSYKWNRCNSQVIKSKLTSYSHNKNLEEHSHNFYCSKKWANFFSLIIFVFCWEIRILSFYTFKMHTLSRLKAAIESILYKFLHSIVN